MSLLNEKKLKVFFDRYFWGQHPEAALRYFPVVREIKKAKLDKVKILEIGSGATGITPYLKKNIDAIDTDFSGPQTNLVNKIKASALKLPFKKNEYDVSLSVDVLEHLQKEDREKAILEMLRVTKKLAIIVVPCGNEAQQQDKELHKHWNKIFNTKNQFLDEHVANGLPQVEDILVYVDRSKRNLAKKANVKSYPNTNLFVRNILMKTWITKNKYFYYLYLKGYLLFVPILKYINFGKTYRRVFVIEFQQ